MATNKIKPIPTLTAEQIEDFWSRVDKTPGHGPNGECWPWTGSLNRSHNNGEYGVWHWDNERYGAHRIALYLQTGEDPGPTFALHDCDWPTCVRHIRPGDVHANVADRVARGRTTRGDAHWSRRFPERVKRGAEHHSKTHPDSVASGERNGTKTHPELVARGEQVKSAKLTADTVRILRVRYAAGDRRFTALGREFGVSHAAVRSAVTGKTWKHLAEASLAGPQ